MSRGPAPPRPGEPGARPPPPAWSLNLYGDVEPPRFRARIGRLLRRLLVIADEHDAWLDRKAAKRPASGGISTGVVKKTLNPAPTIGRPAPPKPQAPRQCVRLCREAGGSND